jgi:cytoskeletal protein RodZ
MQPIGQILREARHAKMATLEDAARATRVKLDILEKLEADEFDQLVAPMYTKGFIKLYAEYLGLDSQAVVNAYLKSQGGLRRQGLHVETEAAIRARRPSELQLPVRGVIRAVAAVTLAVVLGLAIHHFRSHRAQAASKAPAPQPVAQAAPPTPAPQVAAPAAVLPKADIEAYYQPKNPPAPELLDPSGK